MPDTNHPPYNVVQPRVLNRWLDVNSQNGPLQRCATTISIPVFNVISDADHYILGYSRIRGYFQFTSSNKFSLKYIPAFTVTCLVCISWTKPDGTVARYKLNENVGEILYFDCELYKNQRIEKSFRIELWDTAQNTVAVNLTNDSSIDLVTSVLQAIDYRYGTDAALVEPEVLNEAIYAQKVDTAFPLPLTFNTQ